MLNLRYAGIGSRAAPDDVLRLTTSFCNILAELGYQLYTGGCPLGMDAACIKGAYKHKTSDKSKNRIYIAWDGMAELRHDPIHGIYDAQRFENYNQAEALALQARGSFERLGKGGIALHSRNPYQILGDDLNSPVEFVLCWAIPVGNKGYCKGGTGVAVKIAIDRGIPVYNLYHEETYMKIYDIVTQVVAQEREKNERVTRRN